ncbi:hypothetical protein DL96DRAFT_1600033 [Flagelloscypha sp. PMI_526]|nr:hypothetical protein DL96DRAFT_1600033 [Flagelloscypha sp. PMI_526]
MARWSLGAVISLLCTLLSLYTPLSQFSSIASASLNDSPEVDRISKALSTRSNANMICIMVIFVYLTKVAVESPHEPHVVGFTTVTFMLLALKALNRYCFEGIPRRDFKQRVKIVTPVGLAILYMVPEGFVLVFVLVEGYRLAGISTFIGILSVIVGHGVLMSGLLSSRTASR